MGRNNAVEETPVAQASQVGETIAAGSRAKKVLNDRRFIEDEKVANRCVYRVNTRVAWQGNRGERFAHFMADRIAFESEQSGRSLDSWEPLKQVPVLDDGERYLVGNEPVDPPDQGELELP